MRNGYWPAVYIILLNIQIFFLFARKKKKKRASWISTDFTYEVYVLELGSNNDMPS